MELKDSIKFLFKSASAPCTIDLVLKNGNIVLRSFQVLEIDEHSNIIKGLTQQEAYSFVRENRDPVYCTLPLVEIKEITSAVHLTQWSSSKV